MTTALVESPRWQKLQLLRPIAEPAEIIKVQDETRRLVQETLKEGRDYGKIPGTAKNTLLKPGAERVANGFGCQYGEPVIVDKEIDHDREVRWRKRKKGGATYEGISYGLYRYVLKVPVVHLESGRIVGWGAGAASTMESKYIDRPRDMENTVFKMAAKRARIDGCLTTFGLSDQFTQDTEDTATEEPEEEDEEREPRTFTLAEALDFLFPFTTHAKYGGKPLKDVSTHMLVVARDYLLKKIDERGDSADLVEPLTAVELVLTSREDEQRADPTAAAPTPAASPSAASAATSNGSSTSAAPTSGASSTSTTPTGITSSKAESRSRDSVAFELRTLLDSAKVPRDYAVKIKAAWPSSDSPEYDAWLENTLKEAQTVGQLHSKQKQKDGAS